MSRMTQNRPIWLTNARIVDPSQGLDGPGAVLMSGGRIIAAGPAAINNGAPEGTDVINCHGLVVAPGLVDLCAYIGEPGHEHRETFASAGRAAAAGGITTVVAQPDSRWGEVPCAFVELKAGASAGEAELIEFCRTQLARFKAPKRVIFGELPKTATGKVQKFQLREQVKSSSAID